MLFPPSLVPIVHLVDLFRNEISNQSFTTTFTSNRTSFGQKSENIETRSKIVLDGSKCNLGEVRTVAARVSNSKTTQPFHPAIGRIFPARLRSIQSTIAKKHSIPFPPGQDIQRDRLSPTVPRFSRGNGFRIFLSKSLG